MVPSEQLKMVTKMSPNEILVFSHSGISCIYTNGTGYGCSFQQSVYRHATRFQDRIFRVSHLSEGKIGVACFSLLPKDVTPVGEEVWEK